MKKLIVTTSTGTEIELKNNKVIMAKGNERLFETGYLGFLYGKDLAVMEDYVTIAFNEGHGTYISDKLNSENGKLTLSIEKDKYEELKDLSDKANELAKDYFENKIDNVVLRRLSNYSYTIENKENDEEYNNIKAIATKFNDYRAEFIKHALKYSTQETWNEEVEGMIYKQERRYFNREEETTQIEEEKEYKETKEYQEKLATAKQEVKRENELIELAKEVSWQDFEDITGLPKREYDVYRKV